MRMWGRRSMTTREWVRRQVPAEAREGSEPFVKDAARRVLRKDLADGDEVRRYLGQRRVIAEQEAYDAREARSAQIRQMAEKDAAGQEERQ